MIAREMTAREAANHPGLVLCHNVHDPSLPKKVLLRKGHVLSETDRPVLERLGAAPLHLLLLETGDVGEDEAGERIARAVAGPGVEPAGASEGQVRIVASERGLFRVDAERLAEVNARDGVTVWTLEDRAPVEAGQHVASAKVAPLAVPLETVLAAEAAATGGAVRVAPYRDRPVSVLVRENLVPTARARFEATLRSKLEWFGAAPPTVQYIGSGTEAAAAGLRTLLAGRTELVLVGGTGSTDPLDPVFGAIRQEDGELVRTGVPAHPGSTYWLAEVRGTPVLGLASCGMFSQMTALDLLLPRFFAGEPLDSQALTSLAVGGLIGRDRSYRFPRYRDVEGS